MLLCHVKKPKCTSDAGMIAFLDPRSVRDANLELKPEEGDCIMFPSWLKHHVGSTPGGETMAPTTAPRANDLAANRPRPFPADRPSLSPACVAHDRCCRSRASARSGSSGIWGAFTAGGAVPAQWATRFRSPMLKPSSLQSSMPRRRRSSSHRTCVAHSAPAWPCTLSAVSRATKLGSGAGVATVLPPPGRPFDGAWAQGTPARPLRLAGP